MPSFNCINCAGRHFGNSHVQINMEGRRLNHAAINSVTPRVRLTNQVLIACYSRAALEK